MTESRTHPGAIPISESQNSWAFAPSIELEEVGEAELPGWPFREYLALKLKSLPMRRDDNGTQWLVLFEHQSRTGKYPGDEAMLRRLRISQFRVLETVLVRNSDAKNIASNFRSKEETHISHWAIFEEIDNGLLFEALWRKTWNAEKWRFEVAPWYTLCLISHLLLMGIAFGCNIA